MLKTAAMSLLSKTLQSFLHKYLLEVDVEGVAMPSLIDVDGHSGWGVRLCNVKLREGAELMTLPGKRKVRKKTKRKEAKIGNDTEKKSKINNGRSINKKGESIKGTVDELSEKRETHQDVGENAENITTPSPNPSFPRSRLMKEEDVEIDSAISSRDQSPSMFCKTSVADAISGCLSRNHKETKNGETTGGHSPSASSGEKSPTKLNSNLLQQNVLFETNVIQKDGKTHSEQFFKPIVTDKNEEMDLNGTIHNSKFENPGISDNSCKEEEYHTIEEDMVLRLGKSGRIGTLDVRLVGKELHVTVEDAFLTVEACPKPDEPDDVSVKTASTADTTKDDAVLKVKKKKATKSGADKKEKTVGECVIENSPLARALSALPHLFLRDVRIQIIIQSNLGVVSEEEVRSEAGPDDSVAELGIELLSVTGGEDILANFFNDNDPAPPSPDDLGDSSERSRKHVSLKKIEERDENEYLRRRIRTGKGPDGGISIKVYYPHKKSIPKSMKENDNWAYQTFASKSQLTVFRCSGLDIIARIFLGKEKEVAIRNNDYAWYGDEYDEYTIDSMLYGVDYIAPSAPPLPPIQREEDSRFFPNKIKPEVEVFTTDENGIQSNKIRSCFHKVARGLRPTLCKKDHPPSENCPYCWKDRSRPNSYSEHPFDAKTPLPGFVFSVSLNEPLVINIDRPSLEVLGSLQELFIKSPEESESSQEDVEEEESPKPEKTSIAQKIKNMASFRKKERKELLRSAFPSYMKPEAIEILGVFISKIVFRIHAMKSEDDLGLSFRYFEAILRCTTIDVQILTSKEKNFKDVRGDLGFFESYDYRGVEKKGMISLGIRQPGIEVFDSIPNTSSFNNSIHKKKACWPTTAAILLQVPSQAEALKYESRERHALQLRYFFVTENDSDIPIATVKARIGMVEAVLQDSFSSELTSLIYEANSSIFGVQKASDAVVQNAESSNLKGVRENSTPVLLAYTVRLDGGHINWLPLVQVRFPMLKFRGKQSSVSGLLFETVLNHVKIEFGKQSQIGRHQNGLILSRLAGLPVNTRMRVLLFLNDLGPLEKALGLKRENNSFLRCQAVNKAIVKVAKQRPLSKHTKKKKKGAVTSDTGLCRQDILKELMKLDGETLEDIWMGHLARSKSDSIVMKKTTTDE
eukprot:CAMPEP_0194156052 /NCGR_PEP_ID=MMETSP0152-20130528/66889_1 /TAXON_ID=1049557 /ORGANISM="Thalassiothrix antarctica, Strain L6-D1" /LENGTH=1145 /DNA_ID=CAMNT_0038863439 /DNA_START=65 /DNA_END=3502 /DNA_ORIENTATION=+